MSADLAEVRGLHDFWAGMTGHAPPQPLDMPQRVMLDALGLGIGQAMAQFGTRPDWESFAAWITQMLGEPDRQAIARYHAWLDGAPPPAETAERLAAINAAPPVLDAADLAHWDEHGYVVLRGAATPEQASEAAALLHGLVGATPDDPESWYGRDVNSIMVEHFQAPVLTAIHARERIHKAYAQLYGTADLWLQIDRMSFNPPVRARAPGLGQRLHWDASLVTPIPLFIQGILYLTDTSPDQGALELVPGFHRRMESWLADLGDIDPRSVDLGAEAITVGANAGDMILWHQALPHGASPNRAARPRLAHYLTMYSPEILPQADWR
ncbi:phytanoyl-CoA dioxygenase family protein [Sphingomonas sp. LB-2]|uniref:phytanoyl-CoA dioxygenase family protein n=1 Tax=Sphingomonas caeni TaxID=2984949 RepID=UPI00222FCC4C|nr:phytanoyl-CoA dioxygenase family protein [Sphingomonas caeni]MCW3845701.1 phytanoyl-CoA dioxygenase family protein [Sphingomonas caeni]